MRVGGERGAALGLWSPEEAQVHTRGRLPGCVSFFPSTLLSPPGEAQDCQRGGEMVGSSSPVGELSRRTLPIICSSWPRTDPGSSIEMQTLGHQPRSAEISQPIHRTTALFIFTLPPARSLRVGAAFHSDSYAPRPRPQPAVWRRVGRCSVSFCRCDSSTAVRFPMSFSAPATHWTPLRSFRRD